MTDANEEPGPYKQSKVCFLSSNPAIPHKVLRSDVHSKITIGKRNKLTDTVHTNTDITIRNRSKEMEELKERLAETIKKTNLKTQSSRAITFEINRQLEVAHQRELKEQTRNLALQLENMKLRALLDAKANLVNKLMKELSSVRRVVNHVSKDLAEASQLPELINKSNLVHGKFKKEYVDNLMAEALKISGITYDSTQSE